MNSKSWATCLVCGTVAHFRLVQGVFIKGKFMCSQCEQIITEMEMDDICYPLIKERLKEIWVDNKQQNSS
ncbi:MAG: sigma factor G inhibitor Gin [Desulfitobacteriaceae bacterium]|nr:sigma factor G inhibitor Gin [Desulfitobacteriaceae bacterium]MDD4752550.1 sigma factor G inhibitor Gin [Desulfitobacteriaceae bacterium]